MNWLMIFVSMHKVAHVLCFYAWSSSCFLFLCISNSCFLFLNMNLGVCSCWSPSVWICSVPEAIGLPPCQQVADRSRSFAFMARVAGSPDSVCRMRQPSGLATEQLSYPTPVQFILVVLFFTNNLVSFCLRPIVMFVYGSMWPGGYILYLCKLHWSNH